MALAREFLALMPLTISVKHLTGVNEYNEATYGNPIEYRARLEPTRRFIRGPEGTEQVVNARLIVDAQGPLKETDEVTLPDGTQPLVVSVTTEYDEYGINHQTYLLDG